MKQTLRELINKANPELIKESEHEGDTGFYAEPQLNHLLVALKLTDHEWESLKAIGTILHISLPNNKVTHFIDPIDGSAGENYNWTEVAYDLTKPPLDQSEEVTDQLVELLQAKQ